MNFQFFQSFYAQILLCLVIDMFVIVAMPWRCWTIMKFFSFPNVKSVRQHQIPMSVECLDESCNESIDGVFIPQRNLQTKQINLIPIEGWHSNATIFTFLTLTLCFWFLHVFSHCIGPPISSSILVRRFRLFRCFFPVPLTMTVKIQGEKN